MKFLLVTLFAIAPAIGFAKPKTEPGRFQLIQLSDMRRDQFLLDTQTGAIWNKVCLKIENGECLASAWSKEYVEDVTISGQKLGEFIRSYAR